MHHATPQDVHKDDHDAQIAVHKAHIVLPAQQPAAVTGTSTYFSSKPILGEHTILLSALS